MESEIVRRRKLWYAAWLGGALWVARAALIPARLRGPRIVSVSGVGPFYALLGWTYGAGARPQSVIFDLEAGAAAGSVTTDGDALEAEIPLGLEPSGPFTLTVSATYRILGVARTAVTRVTGAL